MKNEKKLKKQEIVWTCDYCEKEFGTKKKSDKHELRCIQNPKNRKFPFNTKPNRAWFYLWTTTVLVFLITFLIYGRYDEYNVNLFNRDILVIIFLSNICLGIFSFLAMFVRYKQKKNQASILTKNILIICLIYLIVNPSIFAIEGFKSRYNEDYKNKYYTQITPIPISIVGTTTTPTSIPTPKKIIKISTVPVNNDPIINCTMNANCGGGIKKIKRSECNNGACCQINGSWIFYTSRQKCIEDQNKNNAQNNSIKYPPCTIYYPGLNRSETYYYTSPTDCQMWKDKANAGSVQTIPTLAPIPTVRSTYIAPTAYVYQTPTPSQSEIAARISRCQSDCRDAGNEDKTYLRNTCRANGSCDSSWYYNGEASINAAISRCISQCN